MSSQENWGRQTRRGIVWSNLAFVGARAFSSLSILILARLLTPADFGVVAAIVVYVAIVELISDVGMRATVVYEQEKTITRRVNTAFTINLGLAFGLSLLCFLIAPLIAGFFRLEDHVDLFRLAAINPLIKGFGNIHDGLLMRAMDFRKRAIPEVVQAGTRAAVSIPLAFAGLGAWALLIGFLCGTLAWTIVQWRLSSYRPRLDFDREIAKSMVSYGTGASLVDIQAAIASRVDLIVIARVLGDRALGLYTIAFRVPELLIEAVAWNTGTVAFSALSRKREDDRGGLADATRGIVRWQALYAIPIGVILAVLGPPLIVTLFGSDWAGAGGVASAVAVMAAVTAVTFPLGDVFKALGKQRVLVALQLLQFPFFVAAIILAAPAGIVAVAWVRTGVRTLHAGLLTVVVSRELKESVRSMVAPMLPALLAGIGAFVGSGAVRLLWPSLSAGPLILGGIAGVAIGLLMLRVFTPATFSELVELGRALARNLRNRRRATEPAGSAS